MCKLKGAELNLYWHFLTLVFGIEPEGTLIYRFGSSEIWFAYSERGGKCKNRNNNKKPAFRSIDLKVTVFPLVNKRVALFKVKPGHILTF